MHNLGRPPRRLTLLHLDGSENRLPAPSAPTLLSRRRRWSASSAPRPATTSSGPIALALVKRNVPLDAQLEVDGLPAAQEVVVDPEVGLHVRR